MAMPEFPQELSIEILSWLPVKSVKRFRCLSKSLCAYIDSPDFIKLHVRKSSTNFNLRKLIFQDLSMSKFHVCDVNLDPEEKVLRLESPVLSPWNLVYGYCKGLLLLHRDQFRFSLWNPSTRQSRNLSNIPLQSSSHNQSYTLIGCGLGYDDSIDDYKAFCIAHFAQNVHPEFEVQFWIYGLKSNIWRRSNNWEFPHLVNLIVDFLLPGFGYFADGIIHWICTINCPEHEIVAFDVRKETFSILPQPVCSLKQELGEGVSTTLHVLEGCLCISYVSSSMPLQADLYIRKKDGAGQFTWTQLFSVREPLFLDKIWFEPLQVLGCLNRGDKIMLDLGMDYLVSFDLRDKTFGKVETDKDSNWKAPILCMENLVPLS